MTVCWDFTLVVGMTIFGSDRDSDATLEGKLKRTTVLHLEMRELMRELTLTDVLHCADTPN